MAKVAAIQMCSTSNVDENLKTAAGLIKQAAANGAMLAVLPEMFAVMSTDVKEKINQKETYGKGKIQDFLKEQVIQNNIWIVGGTIPLACDDSDKIRSACLVFDNHGNNVARYDKMHLFDVVLSDKESYKESDTTQPGTEVVTFDSPVGKLGLSVCYDIRFPYLYNELLKQGAEVIAIPSAFTVKTGQAHWQLLCRARAVENFCYVIGAGQGGMHEGGRETYGHSLIVEPWGTVVAERKEPGAGIIYADIDLKRLHDIRKSIPITEHQVVLK